MRLVDPVILAESGHGSDELHLSADLECLKETLHHPEGVI
jgi:hypothetical protein